MPSFWRTDGELEAALWEEARLSSARAAASAGAGKMLDLGGGAGSFTHYITSRVPGLSAVSIDIAEPSVAPVCDFVLGDALKLPFRDSAFTAVAARAVLHHFPERLAESMAEIDRVLAEGGAVVIQEPCSGNPLAAVARKLFPTDRHDPDEAPLPAKRMVEAVRARFDIAEVGHHFIFSYLAPHAVPRAPVAFRPLARQIGMALHRGDRALLKSSALARRASAYVHISAVKGKK